MSQTQSDHFCPFESFENCFYWGLTGDTMGRWQTHPRPIVTSSNICMAGRTRAVLSEGEGDADHRTVEYQIELVFLKIKIAIAERQRGALGQHISQ